MASKTPKYKFPFALLLLLFFLLAALSILSKDISQNNTSRAVGSSLNKFSAQDIESIEIYKYNPYRETSIENYWFFNQKATVKFIFDAFYEKSIESSVTPSKDANYSIILNHVSGKRYIYPFWFLNDSEEIVFEDNIYYILSSQDSSKLIELMSNN